MWHKLWIWAGAPWVRMFIIKRVSFSTAGKHCDAGQSDSFANQQEYNQMTVWTISHLQHVWSKTRLQFGNLSKIHPHSINVGSTNWISTIVHIVMNKYAYILNPRPNSTMKRKKWEEILTGSQARIQTLVSPNSHCTTPMDINICSIVNSTCDRPRHISITMSSDSFLLDVMILCHGASNSPTQILFHLIQPE